MNKSILNSGMEMQYRLLLLLSALPTDDYSQLWLSGMDFIVEYGHTFGLTEENLHGDSWMKFTEYATKIVNVTEGLHALTFRGWVKVIPGKNGFTYRITASGTEVAEAFATSYALEYRDIAQIAFDQYGDMNEKALDKMIRRKALTSLEQEVPNG